jgi:hypothetical protein
MNIMKFRSTADMDETEKRTHFKAVKMVEKELGLDEDSEIRRRIRVFF